MKYSLKNLSITRVALVPSGSNPQADIVLFKSKPVVSPTQPKEPVFMKKNIDKSKLSATELTQLEALLAKSATDITEPGPPPPTSEEAIIKSLPPEAQAIIQKAQATAAAALSQAEEASATALFEKAQRETTEFVTVNTPLVKAFPGAVEDNAKVLYRVKKAVSTEDYTAVEKMIKAGGAALAQAAAATGVDGGSSTSDAADRLKELAKNKMKDNPKLTFAKAYDEALTENPDLVAEARR